MIHLKASFVSIDAAADNAETPKRSISGLAVPWNVDATVLGGQVVRFLPGSLSETGPAPKLLEEHAGLPIGLVTERVSTEEGMMFVAKLAENNTRANDAMALLTMGAIDAVSVGAIPTAFKYDKNGTMVVSKADFVEISLVTAGAFSDARIYDVAATAQRTQEGVWVEVPNEQEEEESTPTPTPPTEEKEIPMSESPEVVEATTPTPIFATAKREFVLPSAGEWLSAQLQGGSVAAEFNARIRAAAPNVTTSDLDGLLPTPIIPPLYSGIQGLRPVVDAIGARQMPQGGKVFIIPKVTTHTSMGQQTTQNTALTAGQFIVDDIQVTKAIYGGYVELSEASIDWSDPEVLNGLLEDMGKKYALFTDDVAADALVTGTTQTTGNVATTDPSDWIQKVYACANTILASGNYLPDHMFVSGDVFAQLGSLSDTTKRPLFPELGPMNAFGTMTPSGREASVFGLRLVVDTNFAAKTTIVGAAATGAFRCYEQQKGAIVADIGSGASTLSRTVAWRGYFAPIMVDANQFMKIAQA